MKSRKSSNKSLENTSSHRVSSVLMQNYPFPHGTNVSEIKEFSFSIPELINWIGTKTVSYTCTDEEEVAAYEKKLTPVLISADNPHIELYYESKTVGSSIEQDDRTSIIIKKEPRVKVQYVQPENIQAVIRDIDCLMQFFGLLIGSVSVAEDIRLSIDGQNLNTWLYINADFSYNATLIDLLDRPRTYLYVIENSLPTYYLNWHKFYNDDTYALLRRIYFSVNEKKDIFAEDVFVQYMRILDGYHTRISGDEETKKRINTALKASTKEIKRLIFTEEGRPLFEEAMKKAVPEWKYNSSHMGEIAGWIAAGYLAKTPLSYRLQELDSMFLSIIRKNAVDIEKATRNPQKIAEKTDEQLTQLYFKELGDTRNYYSHYKLDNTGVLEFNQIMDSINVLKATIISIFFSHMGIEKDLIRRILEFDSELHWQTMCLREATDRPFEHPSRVVKAEPKSSDEENKSIWERIKKSVRIRKRKKL